MFYSVLTFFQLKEKILLKYIYAYIVLYDIFSRKYLGKIEDQLILICTMQIAMLELYIVWKVKRTSVGETDDGGGICPIEEKHSEYGDFSILFSEWKEDLFFRYTRMNVPSFYELFWLMGPYLKKRSIRSLIYPKQYLHNNIEVHFRFNC